ncbi:MAG: rane-associated protein [Actinomycetota bacterium]|nr:rane-associated protein [Actinomycetota bacterium]
MLPPLLLPSWLDPATLLRDFGLWIALLVIFAECGLLVGFFFPGDSLLFTLGLFIRHGDVSQSLWLSIVLVCIAAIAGNQVGYLIGRLAGPRIFNRPDSRLFKRDYVDKTNAFFEKYGPRAIVLARFVPIVRTFITVTAGVGRMDYRVYTIYTVIGGVLWGTGVTLLGYAMGNVAFVRNHIELILLGIVALSVLPIAVELLRKRRAPSP